MKIALWIVQVLVAIGFLGAGVGKIVTPYEAYVAVQPWAEAFSGATWLIPVIGIIEVLGAIGVIVPAATRIQPMLTPLAGLGLAITMLGAAVLHAARAEWGSLAPNFILMALALFIAYGRFKLRPIAPRGA